MDYDEAAFRSGGLRQSPTSRRPDYKDKYEEVPICFALQNQNVVPFAGNILTASPLRGAMSVNAALITFTPGPDYSMLYLCHIISEKHTAQIIHFKSHMLHIPHSIYAALCSAMYIRLLRLIFSLIYCRGGRIRLPHAFHGVHGSFPHVPGVLHGSGASWSSPS